MTIREHAAAAFVFLLGLFIGSFLGAASYRIPRGISIVWPPSACPACRARLGAADLIPVASYWLLRGRCRHCGAPISKRYVVIELLTGVLFAGVYAAATRGFGAAPDWAGFGAGASLASLLLLMAVIHVEVAEPRRQLPVDVLGVVPRPEGPHVVQARRVLPRPDARRLAAEGLPRHDGQLPHGCRSRVDRELRLGMDHPADAEDAQGILGFHDDGAKAVPAPAIQPDAAAVDEGGQRAQPQVGDPLARGRAVARSGSFAVLRPCRPVGHQDPGDG